MNQSDRDHLRDTSKITVSLVILTWNRRPSVERSLTNNLMNAKYPIREIVHVDNGSEPGFCDWFRDTFSPTVQVRHATNQGVAVGYNRGLALATSSHVVITGMDRIMPNNWLARFVEAFERIPHTGAICCGIKKQNYHGLSPSITVNGLEVRLQPPMHARMHSREFLFKTGFWREDFGLYGYEDAEWSDRADRVANEDGLINYSLISLDRAELLTCEDFEVPVDGKLYWDFKQELHSDPRRRNLYRRCRAKNSPYYNPYARIEPNHLDEES